MAFLGSYGILQEYVVHVRKILCVFVCLCLCVCFFIPKLARSDMLLPEVCLTCPLLPDINRDASELHKRRVWSM